MSGGGALAAWARVVARVLGYALVVAWLTWPLARFAGSALPDTHEACRFDTLFATAVLAHESEALTSAPARLTDLGIYHPTERTLFFGDAAFGALPFFLPAYLLTGSPTFAINFTLLGGIVFTCVALHTVVWWWTRSELAGFFGGWTFLMNSWVLWEFVPTAPYFAVLGFFPFIVYVASVPAASLGAALRLVPLVVLQSLPSMVYLTGAVLGPLTVLGAVRTLRRATRGAGARLLAAAGLSVLLLLPFGAGYLMVRATNPGLSRNTIWAVMMPTRLPWGVLGWNAPTAVMFGALVLIGVGALLFWWQRPSERDPVLRRAWLHGLFWAAVGTAVSLTPVVKLFDRWVTLPHGYLSSLVPAYGVGFFREPRRLAIGGLVGLAILCGLAFDQVARRLRGAVPSLARPAVLLLALLVAGEMYWEFDRGSSADPRWRRPKSDVYPTQQAVSASPRLLSALGQSHGPVLELPLATEPFKLWPTPHARAMYRAIFHGRPLLNGYSGYWPSGFQERMELARTLPDGAALTQIVAETGLETVLVNTDELTDEELAAWTAAAERSGGALRLLERDGPTWVFQVDDVRSSGAGSSSR